MTVGIVQLLRLLLYAAAAFGGGYLLLRFLLPWAAPFIVAFLLSAMIEPLVRKLVSCRWKRAAAAGCASLLLLGVLVYLAVKLVVYLTEAAASLVEKLPVIMEKLAESFEGMETYMASFAAASPPGVSDYVQQAMDSVGDVLYRLPAAMSQYLLDGLAKAAQSSPNVLLFAVTAGIGTYFISASYPKVIAFVSAQIPQGLKERLSGLGRDLKGSFGGFARAQVILMGMTFTQLLIAFVLLGIERPFLPAAVTALVDALPVFGTGIILVPWALYGLLLGNSRQGLGLLICWLVVSLVRNCVQAKLLGDQIGLDPLASLLAIYVGWQVWGVLGMLLFPLVMVTLRQLNDKGVIKLWNRI